MSETLEIVVARHGESKANAEARMQGRFDSPLSERGREQARVLGSWLGRHGIAWDRAYCSPLRRAHETAEIAARAAGGTAVEVEPELAEIAAGKLEGLSAAEITDQYPSYAARKLDELGDFAEYGGESYADVQERVKGLVQRLLSHEAGRRVLLVGHGGFNFHLVKHLICVPVPRVCILRMDNCAATLIRIRHRRGTRIGEVVWHVPAHGIVLWLALPPGLDADLAYEEALRQGVLVSPSTMWSVDPRPSPALRLAFCAEPEGRLVEGARRLGKALKVLLARTPGRARDRERHVLEAV